MDYDTGQNDRRLANVIQFGIVEEVDYSSIPKARVRIGDLLTGWVRMGTSRAGDAHESWGYSLGEEVVVGSMSGDMRQGVILCAVANGAHTSQCAEGTYRATFPGGVTIEIADGAVNITSPQNINVTGDIIVAGDVIADGISLKTHVHGGIDPGPADTGVPK